MAVAHAEAAEPVSDPCRVEATAADVLRVAPPGVEPFVVGVSDGELALSPTDDDRVLAVHAMLPLRFEATTRIEDQRLEIRADGERAAGGVTLASGLPVLRLGRDADADALRAPLRAEVQLGRRFPGARSGLEVGVGPVTLACDDLGVAPSGVLDERATSLSRAQEGELAIVRAPPLVLRPVRAAPTELTVRPMSEGSSLPVWVSERIGDHARVALSFRDGSRLEGWARADALRAPTDEERRDVAEQLRRDDAEPFAESLLGSLPQPTPAAEADAYLGPATLAPDSPVHAEAGGAEWARSPAHPIEVRAFWRRGEPFAQLVEIAGVSVHHSRAWVPRGALRLARPF